MAWCIMFPRQRQRKQCTNCGWLDGGKRYNFKEDIRLHAVVWNFRHKFYLLFSVGL